MLTEQSPHLNKIPVLISPSLHAILSVQKTWSFFASNFCPKDTGSYPSDKYVLGRRLTNNQIRGMSVHIVMWLALVKNIHR